MDGVNYQAIKERRSRVAKSIRRRLVKHIASGCTSDMAKSIYKNTHSSYTDPKRAQLENELLFQRTPIIACFSSDIPAAGDHYIFEDIGVSILIVRGHDFKLRGFLNRCAHRGTKLLLPESNHDSTQRTRIVCPFHAWCYDLEGNLISVPGKEGFDALELNKRKLTPIAVTEFQGLVFVQLKATNNIIRIEEYLGDFRTEIELLELKKMHPVQSNSLNAETNWKYAMDTYCESYHFGVLHRNSIGQAFFSNVATFENYFPHWRICFASRDLSGLVDIEETLWPEVHYNGTHFIFPNTLLVVGSLAKGEMYVRVFRLFPGKQPGQMTCHISVYAPEQVASNEQRLAVEFAYNDVTSKITREDYQVAVEGYKNLKTAPDDFSLIMGKNEPALQAFHRAIDIKMADISGDFN